MQSLSVDENKLFILIGDEDALAHAVQAGRMHVDLSRIFPPPFQLGGRAVV